MGRKKTVEDYKKLAKSCGIEWLGKEPPGRAGHKTQWLCNNEHKFETSYSSILTTVKANKGNNGCRQCTFESRRKTAKDYHALAESREDIKGWIGKLPTSNHIPTEWECKKGHRWMSAYSTIQRGSGCPKCFRAEQSRRQTRKVKRECKICNQKFETIPSRIEKGAGKYCSNECRYVGLRKAVEYPCDQCGKVFQTEPGRIRRHKHKYCSRECYSQWQSKNLRGENHPSWKSDKRKPNNHTCHGCGKGFWKKPAKQYKKRYCSRECMAKDFTIEKESVECLTCGEKFQAYKSEIKRGGGKYCSPKCNYQAKNKQINRVCEQCGGSFKAMRSRIEIGGGRYCSQECAWKGSDTRVTQSCEFCEVEFLASKDRVNAGLSRFCSKQCFDNYREIYNTRVDRICQMCEQPFQIYQSEIKKGDRKFCSAKCYWRYTRENESRTGENSPLWQGGVIEYYGPNWREQRRRARRRDNYICQHCDMTEKENGRRLDVHHIVPFRSFGYIPGKNKNYKKANKLTNLICLCRRCHKLAEHGKISIQPYLL